MAAEVELEQGSCWCPIEGIKGGARRGRAEMQMQMEEEMEMEMVLEKG